MKTEAGGLSSALPLRFEASVEGERDDRQDSRDQATGERTLNGRVDNYFPFFGAGSVSTVVVFGLRSASFTGMKRPSLASRPILRGAGFDAAMVLRVRLHAK